ncbi:MAG: GDSL-type esterase/lipase family protein [Bacteroidota bacterium]|nr:GDSL-type esterase/lipase family protein [Bacteroidota bacterium]
MKFYVNLTSRRKAFFIGVFIFSSLNLIAQIKVACIGNSITAGAGLKKEQAYPTQMQAILGDKYVVRNFGVSGRTLFSKGDNPYIKENAYKDALSWLPGVVIIKLGTNDSKPQNWKYKEEFTPEYIALVNSFKDLPSHPQIYVCYPLPAFQPKYNINDSIITNDIIPMVKIVAKKTKSRIINLNRAFRGKIDLLYDGIHPTAEGDKLLAKIIAKTIK